MLARWPADQAVKGDGCGNLRFAITAWKKQEHPLILAVALSVHSAENAADDVLLPRAQLERFAAVIAAEGQVGYERYGVFGIFVVGRSHMVGSAEKCELSSAGLEWGEQYDSLTE